MQKRTGLNRVLVPICIDGIWFYRYSCVGKLFLASNYFNDRSICDLLQHAGSKLSRTQRSRKISKATYNR